jgi:hypothetical protein
VLQENKKSKRQLTCSVVDEEEILDLENGGGDDDDDILCWSCGDLFSY